MKFFKFSKITNKCCDPFNDHTKKVTGNLKVISSDMAERYDLVLGSIMCKMCLAACNKGKEVPIKINEDDKSKDSDTSISAPSDDSLVQEGMVIESLKMKQVNK